MMANKLEDMANDMIKSEWLEWCTRESLIHSYDNCDDLDLKRALVEVIEYYSSPDDIKEFLQARIEGLKGEENE